MFLLWSVRQFADAAMRADNVAESIKLCGLRPRCESEGPKHGLHDEEPGSGERYRQTPSSVATVHVQSPPSFGQHLSWKRSPASRQIAAAIYWAVYLPRPAETLCWHTLAAKNQSFVQAPLRFEDFTQASMNAMPSTPS